MTSTKPSRESVQSLDGANGIVFAVNVIVAIVLVIFGLMEADGRLFANAHIALIGLAYFLTSWLAYRAIDAFSNHISLTASILEELRGEAD